MKNVMIPLTIAVVILIITFVTPAWKLFGSRFYSNPDTFGVNIVEIEDGIVQIRVLTFNSTSRISDYTYRVVENSLEISVKLKSAIFTEATDYEDIFIDVDGANIENVIVTGDGNQIIIDVNSD